MAFELDPIFHTETMVKILQSQGHLQTATRICEKILEKSPGHPRLQGLLETLRYGGRDFPPRVEKIGDIPADEVTDPGTSLEELKAEAGTIPISEDPEEAARLSDGRARREKLEKLYGLLRKIQERS